jgi:hypothetical protein
MVWSTLLIHMHTQADRLAQGILHKPDSEALRSFTAYVNTSTRTCVHANIRTYIYANLHTYVHACMHTYIDRYLQMSTGHRQMNHQRASVELTAFIHANIQTCIHASTGHRRWNPQRVLMACTCMGHISSANARTVWHERISWMHTWGLVCSWQDAQAKGWSFACGQTCATCAPSHHERCCSARSTGDLFVIMHIYTYADIYLCAQILQRTIYRWSLTRMLICVHVHEYHNARHSVDLFMFTYIRPGVRVCAQISKFTM